MVQPTEANVVMESGNMSKKSCTCQIYLVKKCNFLGWEPHFVKFGGKFEHPKSSLSEIRIVCCQIATSWLASFFSHDGAGRRLFVGYSMLYNRRATTDRSKWNLDLMVMTHWTVIWRQLTVPVSGAGQTFTKPAQRAHGERQKTVQCVIAITAVWQWYLHVCSSRNDVSPPAAVAISRRFAAYLHFSAALRRCCRHPASQSSTVVHRVTGAGRARSDWRQFTCGGVCHCAETAASGHELRRRCRWGQQQKCCCCCCSEATGSLVAARQKTTSQRR